MVLVGGAESSESPHVGDQRPHLGAPFLCHRASRGTNTGVDAGKESPAASKHKCRVERREQRRVRAENHWGTMAARTLPFTLRSGEVSNKGTVHERGRGDEDLVHGRLPPYPQELVEPDRTRAVSASTTTAGAFAVVVPGRALDQERGVVDLDLAKRLVPGVLRRQ